jgi:hypothetical protein
MNSGNLEINELVDWVITDCVNRIQLATNYYTFYSYCDIKHKQLSYGAVTEKTKEELGFILKTTNEIIGLGEERLFPIIMDYFVNRRYQTSPYHIIKLINECQGYCFIKTI